MTMALRLLFVHAMYLGVRVMRSVADAGWNLSQWLYQWANVLYEWAMDLWYDKLEQQEKQWLKEEGER